MLLGIEIGGTKLQFGVGTGNGPPLAELRRLDVNPQQGAEGIRRQIAEFGRHLMEKHKIRGLGIGFGGPVDSQRGRTIISHQVEGWKDFPLATWCREALGVPTILANDSDSAGLAEARFGAGRGQRVVFYTNVGSGIGGALVIEGSLYQGGSGIASEIGHLRPGLAAGHTEETIESISSGWGITAEVRRRLDSIQAANDPDVAALIRRCGGQLDRLNTQTIAQAAQAGNRIARAALDRACETYGWAIAQMITLLAPNIVVVGGGVALVGEELWFAPLRRYVDRWGFPPLRGTFSILPAALGEEVVVHGVLAIAREAIKA